MKFQKNKICGAIFLTAIVGYVILVYLYWVYDTRNIINEINRVAQGKEAIDISNYQILRQKMPFKNEKESLTVSKISRVFTWCFRGKGKIWVRYKIIYKYGEGTKTEMVYDTVYIEKRSKKWKVIQYISPW